MSQKLIDIARQRSNIYGLLSLVFRSEITAGILKQIKEPVFISILSGMGARFENDFLKASQKKLLGNLSIEYKRLFTDNEDCISPRESFHHKRDDGPEKVADNVKNFIESVGIEYKSEYSGHPDHICVELEFMQHLLQEEAQDREKGEDKKVEGLVEVGELFLQKHILNWIPSFCDLVIEKARHSFYREAARVTKHFLEFEAHIIKGEGK